MKIICPFCKGERNIVKDIQVNNEQKYRCMACDRTFFPLESKKVVDKSMGNMLVKKDFTLLKTLCQKACESAKRGLVESRNPKADMDWWEYAIEICHPENVRKVLKTWMDGQKDEDIIAVLLIVDEYLKILCQINEEAFKD